MVEAFPFLQAGLHMGVRSILPATGYSFEIPAGTYAPTWTENQVIYVGKHGANADTGQSIYEAKLTITAGIAQAVADGATALNPYTVVCLDGGIYTENLTLAAGVHVLAPGATVVGTIIVAGDSSIEIDSQTYAGPGGWCITKANDALTGFYKANTVTITGTGNGVLNLFANNVLMVEVRRFFVENGFAIGDVVSGGGHVHLKVGDIYITGTGTAVLSFAGTIVGRIDHISEVGAGVTFGTGFNVFSGGVDVSVDVLGVETTCIVAAAGRLHVSVRAPGVGDLGAIAGILRVDSPRLMGMQAGVGTARTVTGYTILVTDLIPHNINSTAGIINLNLPVVQNWYNRNPDLPFIRIGWTAGANAATVTPNGAETINGVAGAFTIATLNDSLDFYAVPGTGWVIR